MSFGDAGGVIKIFCIMDTLITTVGKQTFMSQMLFAPIVKSLTGEAFVIRTWRNLSLQ